MPFFNNKIFRLALSLIFLAEILSFLGFFLPIFREIGFGITVFLTLIVSLFRLEYGLAIILTELFIGSKGYLFYFQANGLIISIRIALWLVVLAVWLSKFLIRVFRKEEIRFIQSRILPYFLILFVFLLWGLANGFLNHHQFNHIFFDFNGWLYFLLLFPFLDLAYQEQKRLFFLLFSVFWAAIAWLVIETFILLFIFSHNLTSLAVPLYRWVRTSGIGEITRMPVNFYRIFFQSHIFLLPAFFFSLFFCKIKIRSFFKRRNLTPFFLIVFILAVILLSLSRSNWVGLVFGLLVFNGWLASKRSWKQFGQVNLTVLGATVAAIIIIFLIVKFPYPAAKANFGPGLISGRASQITDEAGVSSRWELWPVLLAEIKKAPFIGRGFGATVTYHSHDPRILAQHPDGRYTTYAFEWGWLDIWLKIGVFGLISYLLLLLVILRQAFRGLKNQTEVKVDRTILSLSLGLVSISVVNFFSPYLNHPLGVGYILLTTIFIDTVHSS